MSLQQLLSVFTPIENNLPEYIKTIISEVKQILEAKEKEEALLWVEILKQDLFTLLTDRAYDSLLIQKKSLTYWLSHIQLELLRLSALNKKDKDGHQYCPISGELVNNESFPLLDGHLYKEEALMDWFKNSRFCVYPTTEAPLSDIDKKRVMQLLGLPFTIPLKPNAIELDARVIPETPVPPRVNIVPPLIPVQRPPIPQFFYYQPPVVPASAPLEFHRRNAEVVAQRDRVPAVPYIGNSERDRLLAETDEPQTHSSSSFWNKVKSKLTNDEARKEAAAKKRYGSNS